MINLSKSQKTGVIVTICYHAVILLILLYFGWLAPFPPPAEEGFLVDFGNSEMGIGEEEPTLGETSQIEVTRKETQPVPQPAAKTLKSKATLSTDNGDEDLLTQEYEKTIALNAAKKRAIEEKNAKLKQEQELKAKEERERKAEALEKARQQAEEQRIQKEREQKLNAINSRAKNAFGGGKTDNGSQSTGQGNTSGAGNQGSPEGTPGANQYGMGGGDGKGISFSLSGRSARSLPKPSFPGNESGTVVVEVTVDKYGKVTKALPGIKGSNTVNPDLLEAAKKAALSARFNADDDAPAFQKGSITYHFILQ